MPDENTSVISEVIPPRVRATLYVLSAMFAAAYAVIAANIDIDWIWQALYAAWNALVGVVAAANTNRASGDDVP